MKKNQKIIPIDDTHAAIGVAVSIILFLIIIFVRNFGDEFVVFVGGKSNLSGWVQALFSVFAIVVAIIIPYRQYKDSREKDNVIALLGAISMTERLRVLYNDLQEIEEAADGYLCGNPEYWNLATVFAALPSIVFPDMKGRVDLAPIGMKYLRKAFAASVKVSDFRTYVDEFYKNNNESRDAGNFALGRVISAASEAATYCHEARLELEKFIAKNDMYKDW